MSEVRNLKNAGRGRPKGARNKFPLAVKELFLLVNQDIGGREAMGEWAKKHRTDFYKLLARLIPTEIHAQVTNVTRLSYAEERAREAAGETPGLAPRDTLQ